MEAGRDRIALLPGPFRRQYWSGRRPGWGKEAEVSERLGFLAVVLLAGGLPAQEASPCPDDVPTLHLHGPPIEDGVLSLRWGAETRGIEIEARLDTGVFEVQGYSISVETLAGPLQVVDVRSSGVWQEAAGGGFHKTELAWRTQPRSGPASGFISAFVAGFIELSPPRGDHPLVRAWYDVDPAREHHPILDSPVRIGYRDGLRGSGQPVPNVLTIGGDTVMSCTETLDFQVRVELPFFLRGDANADG